MLAGSALAPLVSPAFSPGNRFTARRSGLLVSLAAALALLAISRAGSAQTAAPPLQVLANHVPQVVRQGSVQFLRQLPDDQKIDLTIILPLRNQDQLTQLLGRLYDPQSPDYRKFLSVEQFTQQFGPSEDDFREVAAFANANGLTITGQPRNRMVLSVEGTAAQVNSAFHVQMREYQHPTENRTFYAPDREPSVAVRARIAHISGMDNFSLPRRVGGSVNMSAATPELSGSGPGGLYLGSDIRAAYYGGSALTGLNQTVGVLEFLGYAQSDVDQSFSSAGQTNSVPLETILVAGAQNTLSYGDAEDVLDIVAVIGMAPGLSAVQVYIGDPNTDSSPTAVLNQMAADNTSKTISCSWFWNEDSPSTNEAFFQAEEPIFQEMAAQGQTFFSGSGDTGAYQPAQGLEGGLQGLYPASSQYVTAVGGTTKLTTAGPGGAWQGEAAWSASGGGINPFNFGIPSWQSGLANSSNGGSNTLRNVPDVAAEAGDGMWICANAGYCGAVSGTSLASPLWAGFMALVNQQAVESGNAPSGSIGFINDALSRIGTGPDYAKDFHDIQSGNNDDVLYTPSEWFNAVPGYDLVTGWGTPGGQPLIDDLAGPPVPGFGLSSSAGTLNVPLGSNATTTVSVADAGGFSGMVDLAVTSALPSGVTASFSPASTSASSVLTLTASNAAVSGSYVLTITGTSGSIAESTVVTANVGPMFTLSTGQAAYTVGQGTSSSGSLSLTGSNGFSGAVTLSLSGLPAGVTVSFGSNPLSAASTPMTIASSSSAALGTYTVTVTGTSGAITASTSFTLTVMAPSFTLTPSPGILSLTPGSMANATVAVNGFSGVVSFSISGLPAGVTAAWNPASSGSAGVVTLTAANSAPLGNALATITGTSGALSATARLNIEVRSAAPTSSTTALAISSGGSAANTVAWGTAVTFTAVVTSGGASVTSGLVNFCDSTALYCGDIHLLGSAQLTSTGAATMILWPTPGSHSYKAEFTGTANNSASSSAAASLEVTGLYPSTTSATSSGTVGNYTLNATVNGAGPQAPTGSVSFVNTSNGNAPVASANLVAGTPALNWAPLGSFPHTETAMTTGDFNNDGMTDVALLLTSPACPNGVERCIAILLGKADGTFAASSIFLVAVPYGVMAAADFNSDGNLDFALLDTSGNLNIFLGNGDGTFNPVSSIQNLGGDNFAAMISGDFNRDGIPDLAISDATNNTLAILLGNGDGTFNPGSTPATGNSPAGMAAADFNGDGLPDIAVANYNDNTVSILLSNGDGTFTAAPTLGAGYTVGPITAGDFNGDGKPDLAVLNSGNISIFLGNGDGTFKAAPSPSIGDYPAALVPIDANEDGIVDLVALASDSEPSNVLLGNGDGTFTAGSSLGLPYYAIGGAAGTATSSGTPEVIALLLDTGVYAYQPDLTQSATASAAGISMGATASNTVAASYGGDTTYSGSQSNTVDLNGTRVPLISWSAPASIVYGTPLSAGQLNATANVQGTFVYSPAAGTVLTAGTQTLTVTFTPTDATDYVAATATVQLVVTQATPTITWAAPAAIVYKTPLGAAQYNATASAPGTFVYTPVAGTVMSAGTQTLSVTLLPTDSTDYMTATQTVQLTVNPAALTVTANNASMTYGSAVPTLGGAVVGLLFGDGITASYATTATSASTVGAYPITATLDDPNHKLGNYLLTNTPGTLTIGQAVPAITWSPASITYGTALGAAQLDASTPVAGSFSYSPAAGTLLGAGSQTLVAAFTPTDNTDYAKTAISAALIVGKATPQVGLISSATPVLSQNPVTLTATVSSSVSTPTGSVTFLNGSTVLGSAVALNSSGVAALTTTALPVGSDSITAVYSGDANFVTGISSAVADTIEDFSLTISGGSGSITSATVMPGQTATFNFVISPLAPATTLPAAIDLAVSGLPPGATYTITPQSLAAGSGSTAVTLTVTTSATAANRDAPLITPLGRRMSPLALALLLLPFARKLRRAGRRLGRVLILLAVLVAGAAAVYSIGGCGGTSGQAQQTYSIFVTGTSGSLSHSTSVSLTVE